MHCRNCKYDPRWKAKPFDAHASWPQLQGTEKQVSWATDIRSNHIALIAEIISRFDGSYDYERLRELTRFAINIRRTVPKIIEARWWIENKDVTGDVLMVIFREIHKHQPAETDSANTSEPNSIDSECLAQNAA